MNRRSKQRPALQLESLEKRDVPSCVNFARIAEHLYEVNQRIADSGRFVPGLVTVDPTAPEMGASKIQVAAIRMYLRCT